MPTYEYRREDGTTFEVFQRMSDDPLTVDPETGQRVTRVIGGGTGLIFKGEGFYLTDYARKQDASGSASDAKPDGAASNGDAANKQAADAQADTAAPSKPTSASSDDA